MPPIKKLLVIQAAALGYGLARKHAALLPGFNFTPLTPAFPGVTCTVQASVRTASSPTSHGMIANGLYFKQLKKCMFWEQSAGLVDGERIWNRFRLTGGKTGMLFWQQSLGENIDLVVSPKPIHLHGGGMTQDVYTQPQDGYERLRKTIGRPFNLMNYWGPLAGAKSSDWITSATCEILKRPDAPDLLFTYIPHLDYDLQRHGPDSARATKATSVFHGFLRRLTDAAKQNGYEWVVFGDYAIEQVTTRPLFPNLILRQIGLMQTRTVRHREYADLFTSRAFAMVDHQIAHLYFRDIQAIHRARELFEGLPGIRNVLQGDTIEQAGLKHERAGQLILEADKGTWFAYPWWENPSEAPDFASHVDIHNKPGYDPCELFFGWPPPSVSTNTQKVGGTHGRRDPELLAAFAASSTFEKDCARACTSHVALGAAIRDWLLGKGPA